ncbi:MAG: four helix bundle protein [Luteitalea sp.]|nr:four helix bundle protein [Luteitalea sp.]
MQRAAIRTFKDLVVWQKAFRLAVDVHQLTKDFPAEEKYGLSAELRKTARSVTYNIAEGHRRGTTPEYLRFLRIAAGSVAELETQVLLARALRYFSEDQAIRMLALHGDIERMLAALINKLRAKQARSVGCRPI